MSKKQAQDINKRFQVMTSKQDSLARLNAELNRELVIAQKAVAVERKYARMAERNTSTAIVWFFSIALVTAIGLF